jgi:hypothetical protein
MVNGAVRVEQKDGEISRCGIWIRNRETGIEMKRASLGKWKTERGCSRDRLRAYRAGNESSWYGSGHEGGSATVENNENGQWAAGRDFSPRHCERTRVAQRWVEIEHFHLIFANDEMLATLCPLLTLYSHGPDRSILREKRHVGRNIGCAGICKQKACAPSAPNRHVGNDIRLRTGERCEKCQARHQANRS